jgi:hypothetical protein
MTALTAHCRGIPGKARGSKTKQTQLLPGKLKVHLERLSSKPSDAGRQARNIWGGCEDTYIMMPVLP